MTKHDFETKEEAAERADKENGEAWPECKSCHVRRWHVDETSECKNAVAK